MKDELTVGSTKPSSTDLPTSERKPNLRDIAYEHLQELWLNGKITPGQWLSQSKLVEMTGATMAAVRDALKRMEAEGLIVLQPKRGVFILEVTPRQISELFDFRIMVEIPAGQESRSQSRGSETERDPGGSGLYALHAGIFHRPQ